LLSWMSSVKSLAGIRVQYSRWRQPAIQEWADELPSDIRPLTAMAKRASPQAFQPIPKDAHRPKISRYSVVLIEAPQNAPQPCSGLVQRLVHPAAPRLLHLLQLLSPLAPVHGRIPAELQQTRLLRMKLQIELRQSFPKLVQETLGIILILKT